jgi:hypothetical protein
VRRQEYEEVFEQEGAMNVIVLYAFEGAEHVQGTLEADEPDHPLRPTRSATVRRLLFNRNNMRWLQPL